MVATAEHDDGVVAELRARHGRSTQPESGAVLAVLQAVLDVLAAEGMAPSPTAIFAACMSSLESSPDTRKDPLVRRRGRGGEAESDGDCAQDGAKTPLRRPYLGRTGRGRVINGRGIALPSAGGGEGGRGASR